MRRRLNVSCGEEGWNELVADFCGIVLVRRVVEQRDRVKNGIPPSVREVKMEGKEVSTMDDYDDAGRRGCACCVM